MTTKPASLSLILTSLRLPYTAYHSLSECLLLCRGDEKLAIVCFLIAFPPEYIEPCLFTYKHIDYKC